MFVIDGDHVQSLAITVGYRSQAAQFAIWLGYGYSNRLGMDIHTQKSYLCFHDRFLSACGSDL